jgi:CAP12/Pycsar effector protein, TIR domain
MDKPRIFLGSSGKQAKLRQALTRGLSDIAEVEPWTTSFNPGTSTLERLLELTREVDFAAFIFAQDDWTTSDPSASPQPGSGQASPRDNVVFEAGLFGGVLGIRRTFILHAKGAKLPSDLLGLTCVRYADALTPFEMRNINEKIRNAIENEISATRIDGSWWQFSLTERTTKEPSVLSLLKISRDRNGALELTGRSWREDGSLSARYRSEAVKERKGRLASSTIGRESVRWTRMRRSWKEQVRSGLNPLIAHPGTLQLARIRIRMRMRGRPVFIGAPLRTTQAYWTAATIKNAWRSLPSS